MNKIDGRGKLDETVFTYRATKDGKLVIGWQSKVVTTLSGERARKLLQQIEGADHKTEQLALAKAMGHFKHKQRTLKEHPRMPYEHILLDRDGAVATITLNRPKQLNALSAAVVSEVGAAIDELATDDTVRAIIITGAGERAFAAGADIGELNQIGSATDGRRMAERSHRLGRKMADLPKPLIAAINGFALGGGLELALACDVRIASDTAQVGLPEVTLGIMPGWGGTQRLARLVGPGAAKLLMMTGDRIDAGEALRLGIVERVVPAAELMDTATQIAQKLAGAPPLSIDAIKQAVNRGSNMALDDANALEASLFGALTVTEDAKEGTAAFLAKRKAAWKGK